MDIKESCSNFLQFYFQIWLLTFFLNYVFNSRNNKNYKLISPKMGKSKGRGRGRGRGAGTGASPQQTPGNATNSDSAPKPASNGMFIIYVQLSILWKVPPTWDDFQIFIVEIKSAYKDSLLVKISSSFNAWFSRYSNFQLYDVINCDITNRFRPISQN